MTQDWIQPKGISNQGPRGEGPDGNPVLKESLFYMMGSERFPSRVNSIPGAAQTRHPSSTRTPRNFPSVKP